LGDVTLCWRWRKVESWGQLWKDKEVSVRFSLTICNRCCSVTDPWKCHQVF
jgi:hypothetical protein